MSLFVNLIYFLTLKVSDRILYEDMIMVEWFQGGRDKFHPHYHLVAKPISLAKGYLK